MRAFLIILSFLVGRFAFTASVDNPFTIISKTKKTVLSREALVTMGTKHIKMNYSRAYPRQLMNYQVIRMCDLLKRYAINPESILEFIAEDDFSVLIPAHYLLNCNKNASVAYLAIEPESKWPILFNHTNTTAGPYALIWTHPKRSYISDEYWAWSTTKIIEHATLNETQVIAAPKNLPTLKKKQILNGYQVYVSHCSSCHTINNIGKGHIGPNLTSPKNVFAYYPDVRKLKQFIRNPASVRQIPNGRMSGSSYAGLNDNDLDDLISYFKFIN
ncbi:c-type cytochrome [Legionella sp. D16C41]|uniref:c-type cytochrome n=1 Tax=Legionella sp. D16C41 TaxID=3402688 RepID=UPI003AF61106